MKFKKIIAALALPFMALFASCEQDPEMMPKISTDKSVYEVGVEGGDVVVKLLATQDWKAVVSPSTSLDEVDDITVDPVSGSASGQIVDITVKVPENKGYNRKANIAFEGATVSGAVTIEQKGAEGERLLTCTIAEFLEKPVDASVYYVLEGEVTNSAAARETYGNFTLLDPESGASVYIYGLAYKEDVSNQKVGLLAAEGINDGDWIKIASTRGEYNGTIEGLNSYYISHKKSEAPMINLGSSEVTAAKGSTFELAVTSNVVTWTLTSNVSWLSFEPATGDKSTTVVVTVAEDGEGEEGIITLAAEGLESVTCTVTRTDIMDITIADFLAAEVSDKPYRITAKIESIVKEEYGNFYAQDGTGRVYVYGLTATPVAKNDKSFASLGLRAGDIVTFVGNRGRYADAKVEDQKEEVVNAYYENSCKSTDVTISEFLTKEVASKYLESPYYRLTGIVKEIVKEEYGNIYLKEENSDTFVYVYGITKAPVAKNDKSFASLGVKAGDKLTIVGQRGQYANAKDENQKEQVANAYFISVESGDTPVPPVEEDLTVENATIEVEADATSASFTVKSNLDWTVSKVEGDWVTSFTESGSKDGNITVEFAANEGEARTAKFTVKGGEKSVELTLTQKAATAAPEVAYKTLAELNAAIIAGGEEGIGFTLDLEEPAVLTKISGKTYYFEDKTAGIMYYGSAIEGAAVGMTIKGKLTNGAAVMYSGLPEVTFVDFSEATIGITSDIPCTNLTIAQLNADFNKYLNMQVKLSDVEVADAFSNSDRNGKVKQGNDEIAVYVKTEDVFEVELGAKGNIIVFPAIFNSNKQVYIWEGKDFEATLKGASITLASAFSVNVGETVSLNASTNSTATIKYVSADETVATVSAEGVVTGVKEGTVEITASVEAVEGFSAAEAKTTITVKPAGTVEKAVYTLTFPDENSDKNKSANYTSTWEAIINGFSWEIVNFNNNIWNDWTFIRCGSKKAESKATISTKTVIPEAISSFSVTFGSDRADASIVNESYLEVSVNSDYSESTKYPVTVAPGEQTISITAPTKSCYYRLVFDMKKASKNGAIEISKLVYAE